MLVDPVAARDRRLARGQFLKGLVGPICGLLVLMAFVGNWDEHTSTGVIVVLLAIGVVLFLQGLYPFQTIVILANKLEATAKTKEFPLEALRREAKAIADDLMSVSFFEDE